MCFLRQKVSQMRNLDKYNYTLKSGEGLEEETVRSTKWVTAPTR